MLIVLKIAYVRPICII